jgi:hypothetical protein
METDTRVAPLTDCVDGQDLARRENGVQSSPVPDVLERFRALARSFGLRAEESVRYKARNQYKRGTADGEAVVFRLAEKEIIDTIGEARRQPSTRDSQSLSSPSPTASAWQPRFFRSAKGFEDDTLFVRIDPDGRGFLVLNDGRVRRYTSTTLTECLAWVANGSWREFHLNALPPVPSQE